MSEPALVSPPDAVAGPLAAVLRRLTRLAPLAPEEIALVAGLTTRPEIHLAGADLTHRDGSAPRPRLLLSGWACRQHLLSDGRRQILDFLLPGDAIGFAPGPSPIDLRPMLALTRIEWADGGALREALARAPDRWPRLARAFALSEGLAQTRLIDHTIRLGRQSAYERVAHLLLELHDRLHVVGLADGATFPLPLTQEALADALALSVVHVNRVLKRLRGERRLAIRAGRVTLLRPDLLALSAEYRSPYG